MSVDIKKIKLSNKLFLASIFIVGALLVFWIFFDSNRNSVEKEIFRADVNPGIVTFRKGDMVEQKFGLPDEKISGVVLLVNPDKDSGRKINLAIFDKKGKKLFDRTSYSVSYLEGKNAYKFTGKVFDSSQKERYFLRVTLRDGQPLELKVRENTDENPPLLLNNVATSTNLAFSVLYDRGFNADELRGFFVALFFTLFLVLSSFLRGRKKHLLVFFLLLFFLLLAVYGLWWPGTGLGVADWDLNMPTLQGYRDSIIKYNQFPLWNTLPCGGTAALADPEFSVISFPFLLIVLFGVEFGVRLGIIFSVVIVCLGSFLLARHFKISLYGSLLSSLVISIGGAYIIHLVEGHIYICFAYAWMPWLILYWLISNRNGKQYYLPALFLVLMFMQGGVYVVVYSVFVYLALVTFSRNKINAIKTSVLSGLWFVGVSAVKLVPALFWLSHYKDTDYTQSGGTLLNLNEIFLGRHLHGSSVLFNQGAGWHELGSYTGPMVLLLALIAILCGWKNKKIQALFVCSVIAIIIAGSGNWAKVITDAVDFIPRSNLSRFVLLVNIPIALLAGFGYDNIKNKTNKIVSILVIGLVAIDIFSLTLPMSKQAFVLDRGSGDAKQQIEPAQFPVAYSWERLPVTINNREYTRRYLYTLKGYGFMDYCPSLKPPTGVISNRKDAGEKVPYLDYSGQGIFKLSSWSPNKFVVDYNISQDTVVKINQNYAPGWYVNNVPIDKNENRITTTVKRGSGELVYKFVPEGMWLGILISVGTVLVLLTGFFRRWRFAGRTPNISEK